MDTQQDISQSELFELELDLPNDKVYKISERLIGFDHRFKRVQHDMEILTDPSLLKKWSREYHKEELPICDVLTDRYPLIIFEGDVGTGKTATAEACCDRLAREFKKPSMLFKLSTRVRGAGKVGQMSMLINNAFQLVVKQAGKAKLAFFILDEADSLAASRNTEQSHHEDKVAVNTLIQKIDDLRKSGGRVLVFLCTNRVDYLDPAILRRAARIETFERPNEQEREELIKMDFRGMNISVSDMKEIVSLTGPHGGKSNLGFTFSDLRTRLYPEAIRYAYPTRRLGSADLIKAAKSLSPTPSMNGK